jgi:hypothetical protein
MLPIEIVIIVFVAMSIGWLARGWEESKERRR